VILYVDDEPSYVDDYIEVLRASDYEVVTERNVDQAWKSFEENLAGIQLLVVDLMMAPAAPFNAADTHGGLWTGVRFFEMARAKAPQLPIIILTNLHDDQIEQRFRSDERCRFLLKENTDPFELTDQVKRLLTDSEQVGA
jgi:CheY-like chemotaxis protein